MFKIVINMAVEINKICLAETKILKAIIKKIHILAEVAVAALAEVGFPVRRV